MKAVFALAFVACLAAGVAQPTAAGTVVDAINGNPQLATLSSLISAADLTSALAGAGPFTIFAPTDDAFAAVPSYKTAFLKQNVPELQDVLKYHVVAESLSTSSLQLHEKITTMEGDDFFVEYITNTTTLGLVSETCEKDVRFVGDQVTASNGIVHVIDTVLMPSGVFCPDQVFFVEQRGESRVGYLGYDCRAKGTVTLTNNEEKPVGIAVDSNEKMVFWSNDQNAQPFDSWLTQESFDKDGKKVFLNDLFDPQGMDTDMGAKKLYFTEHQGYKVHRSNYDGTDVETLRVLDSTDEFPADVAVDEAEQLVFMAIQSKPQDLKGKLAVMSYNGSNYRVLEENLIQNYGLCVDKLAKHVYYIQGGHGGGIYCYPYGHTPCAGTSGKIIDGLEYPYMCAVDNLWAPYGGPTTVLFSEANYPGQVYAMNADGTNMRTVNSELSAPMGIKLGCTRGRPAYGA